MKASILRNLSDQSIDTRSEVVLPSALVLRVRKVLEASEPSVTVSEFVEKVVRSAVALEESKSHPEGTEDNSEAIKSKLRALGYL